MSGADGDSDSRSRIAFRGLEMRSIENLKSRDFLAESDRGTNLLFAVPMIPPPRFSHLHLFIVLKSLDFVILGHTVRFFLLDEIYAKLREESPERVGRWPDAKVVVDNFHKAVDSTIVDILGEDPNGFSIMYSRESERFSRVRKVKEIEEMQRKVILHGELLESAKQAAYLQAPIGSLTLFDLNRMFAHYVACRSKLRADHLLGGIFNAGIWEAFGSAFRDVFFTKAHSHVYWSHVPDLRGRYRYHMDSHDLLYPFASKNEIRKSYERCHKGFRKWSCENIVARDSPQVHKPTNEELAQFFDRTADRIDSC